jgi:uncharacterized protein YjiS (DUF1127 family)
MPGLDMAVARGSPGHRLHGLLGRLVEGWRRVRAGRACRDALAELDPAALRDIGLDTDEIARAHSGEDFVPRAWA